MGSAPSLDRLRQSLSNVTWRETLGKQDRIVVALNDQGARLPFFCVHSLTGKATDYVPLAQKLGPDQPFFSLQIPHSHRTPDFGGEIAPLSIETLAAHYAQALTAFRPKGAIALGGWSIGAIIALEMARRLKAQGRHVPLLVAMDMVPWNVNLPAAARIAHLADTLWQAPAWLGAHKLVKNGVRFGALVQRAGLKLSGVGSPEQAVGQLVDISRYAPTHVALMEHLFENAHAYRPRPYDGPVQIYAARADVALSHFAELKWGWRQIAPGPRILAVPGAHQTLFNGRSGDRLAAHLGCRLTALS